MKMLKYFHLYNHASLLLLVRTFLQLDVEYAAFVLQVGAVGDVGAYPALQGGGGGRRGPGDQRVG